MRFKSGTNAPPRHACQAVTEAPCWHPTACPVTVGDVVGLTVGQWDTVLPAAPQWEPVVSPEPS